MHIRIHTHTHARTSALIISSSVYCVGLEGGRERSISYWRVLEMLWRSDQFDLFTFGTGSKQASERARSSKKLYFTMWSTPSVTDAFPIIVIGGGGGGGSSSNNQQHISILTIHIHTQHLQSCIHIFTYILCAIQKCKYEPCIQQLIFRAKTTSK